MLGADVLSRLGSVTIDFADRRVVIGAQTFSGSHDVPLDIVSLRGSAIAPVAHATIDGRPGNYLIDTGSATTLLSATATAHDHLPTVNHSQTLDGAAGCSLHATAVKINDWKLAALSLPPTIADSASTSVFSKRIDGGSDGLIALDVLSHFSEVTVDFLKHELILGGTLG